jgi:hypothetical protein
MKRVERCTRRETQTAVHKNASHQDSHSEVLPTELSVEAHRVVTRRGFHIFYKIDSQMAVRLSALRAGHPLPPRRFLVHISVRDSVDPRAILRLEGLGQLKKFNDLIGNRTRVFPACSIVPQPSTLPDGKSERRIWRWNSDGRELRLQEDDVMTLNSWTPVSQLTGKGFAVLN